MKFTTVASAALLAGTALAMPAPETIEKMTAKRHERLGKRLAKNRRTAGNFPLKVNHTSHTDTVALVSNNKDDIQYDSNWAGAVQIGSGITEVQGSFVSPSVSGQEGAGAAFWVGIDGDTCQSAILQTGVSGVVENGEGVYAAWYEWYPNYSYTFEGFEVSPGDEIYTKVKSTSTTSGTATVENKSTGKSVTHTFTNQGEYGSLCNENAEWIVEDFESGGELVNFADFGSVTFTGASYNKGGVSGSTIIEVQDSNGDVVATASTPSDSEVYVKYTGN